MLSSELERKKETTFQPDASGINRMESFSRRALICKESPCYHHVAFKLKHTGGYIISVIRPCILTLVTFYHSEWLAQETGSCDLKRDVQALSENLF